MAELRIPIIVENKGKKAFGEANKQVNVLDKSVKKLGKSLAAVFGAQQLLKFAKNASMAFIEDEKAANRLALAVKNLGLAFETPRIEQFISDLSRASGVTDDELRPAMQRLLQTTGSVTKAQELLAQATDIAAGSGVAYETVANDLAMAYVGQTRGLRKYSLGLTQAELKTMKFTDLQERLNKQFSGANAAFLTTYAGKMQILSTAAGEASESIGKGLVDALSLLAGKGNTVQPLADSMQDFGTSVGDAILGVAVLVDKLKSLPIIGSSAGGLNTDMIPILGGLVGVYKDLAKAGKAAREAMTPVTQGYLGSMPVGIYETGAQAAARKKAEADAAKRARELAALQKKTVNTQKQANALAKAAKTIDLERIGLTAALKGQISETDRISLQLQLALLDKNDAAATKLSAELTAAVQRQNDLKAALLATPEAPNPYRNWVLPTELLNYTAASLGTSVAQLTTAPIPPSSTFSDAQMELAAAVGSYQRAEQQAINIEVYLDGQAVGGAIRDTSINDSLSGSFNTVSRVRNKGANAIL